jgi:glycosyltransferase involved in cell wall biosynthesis
MQPLVSIGMPVFNGERYLETAIRSNLAQTVGDLELIISDNASTDLTEQVARDFAASDPRVRYHRNERNIGAAANYNKLFQLAKAEFFRWSNADDIPDRHLIEQTLPVLQSRPDAVLAYGRTCLIDAGGNSLGDYADNLDLQSDSANERYQELHRRVGLSNVIYGLMRSNAMRKTSLMGNGKIPSGDVHFMAAMALLGKFVEVPQLLFFRRMHEGAFSANPDAQAQRKFWNGSGAPLLFPHWRSEVTDARAILRAPLPAPEKLKLLAYATKRLHWQRAALVGDLVSVFSRTKS